MYHRHGGDACAIFYLVVPLPQQGTDMRNEDTGSDCCAGPAQFL
jgi:hypothetical protein